MTTYLGGPMRGHPDFNFPRFDEAAARLRDYGHHVLSPAEHDRETGFDETKNTLDGFDFAAAFAWDLASIAQADIVVFLPGWERSSGCAAEYAHARQLGRDVYAYRPAEDDPSAPFGFRLDLIPDDYTPEVDPLDPANPEPHVIDGDVERYAQWARDELKILHDKTPLACEIVFEKPEPDADGRVLADGESIHDLGRDFTVLRVAEPLPVTKHILGIGLDEYDRMLVEQRGRCAICGEETSATTPPDSGQPAGFAAEDRSRRVRRIVVDPDTGGAKETRLARFDLIPAGPLWQLAEHYGKGARKYDDDNWRRGYSWRLSFAALMRHAWAFWRGETHDPETGSHHMTAVAWHAMALVEFADTHPEKDDRPTPERAE